MSIYIHSEYARSHAGKNYQARCSDCQWKGAMYGGHGLCESQARAQADRHRFNCIARCEECGTLLEVDIDYEGRQVTNCPVCPEMDVESHG